jgi:hypothetical protein
MGDPDTAALDPIYWLHHANIDRLWQVWRHRDPSFKNPTDTQWLTGVSFDVHDASGTAIKFNASQMGDTTKALHGYKCETYRIRSGQSRIFSRSQQWRHPWHKHRNVQNGKCRDARAWQAAGP